MVTHWQNFLLTNFLFMLTFYIRVSSNFSIIIIMSRLSLIIISYNNCNFFFELQTVSLTWKLQISMAGFHNLLQLHLQRFSGYDMILPKRLLPLVDQSADIVINSVILKIENWACVSDFGKLTASYSYDMPLKLSKKVFCQYAIRTPKFTCKTRSMKSK